jgi:hypothetical protein
MSQALRDSGRRAVAGLRDFADQLDAAGLRPLGTTALHEAREIESMLLAAMQRLDRANDNEREP